MEAEAERPRQRDSAELKEAEKELRRRGDLPLRSARSVRGVTWIVVVFAVSDRRLSELRLRCIRRPNAPDSLAKLRRGAAGRVGAAAPNCGGDCGPRCPCLAENGDAAEDERNLGAGDRAAAAGHGIVRAQLVDAMAAAPASVNADAEQLRTCALPLRPVLVTERRWSLRPPVPAAVAARRCVSRPRRGQHTVRFMNVERPRELTSRGFGTTPVAVGLSGGRAAASSRYSMIPVLLLYANSREFRGCRANQITVASVTTRII